MIMRILEKKKTNISQIIIDLFDNLVVVYFSQSTSISEIKESTWMKEIN